MAIIVRGKLVKKRFVGVERGSADMQASYRIVKGQYYRSNLVPGETFTVRDRKCRVFENSKADGVHIFSYRYLE